MSETDRWACTERRTVVSARRRSRQVGRPVSPSPRRLSCTAAPVDLHTTCTQTLSYAPFTAHDTSLCSAFYGGCKRDTARPHHTSVKAAAPAADPTARCVQDRGARTSVACLERLPRTSQTTVAFCRTLVVAHCGPIPVTCGSCSCREHITNSVIGVSRPPVLACGTTFQLDYGGRDLPSTPSDNL